MTKDNNKTSVDVFLELLPGFLFIPGEAKEKVRQCLRPLISSGAFSFIESVPYHTRDFYAVENIDTGERVIDVEFKAGVCIALTLRVPSNQIYQCARHLGVNGFSYKAGPRHWTKKEFPFVYRAQQSDKGCHLLTCRRLLKPIKQSSQSLKAEKWKQSK